MFDFTKKNSVIKNVALMLFGNVFSQIVNLFVFIYIARYFGPRVFGDFNWSKVFIQYFVLLATFGFDNVAMIKILKNKNNIIEMKKIYSNIFIFKIIFSITSYTLMALIVFMIDKTEDQKFLTFIIGLSILTIALNNTWFFRSFQQAEIPVISEVIKILIYTLLVLINLFTIKSVFVLALSWIIAEIIGYIYTNLKSPFKVNISGNLNSIENIKLGFPFFVSGFFATISLNIDVLIIGLFRTSQEVGLYSAVFKLISLVMLVASFVFNAIKPILIENYHNKQIHFLADLNVKMMNICLYFILPLATYGIIDSENIINLVYGSDYIEGKNVFILLILYISIFLWREIYGYQMISYNLQNKYMNIVIVSGVLNLLLNLLLIPSYGIIAAAITTLCTEIINFLIMRKSIKKIIKYENDNKQIIRIIGLNVSTLAINLILGTIVENFVCLILLTIFVYVIISHYLKIINLLKIIAKIKEKIK